MKSAGRPLTVEWLNRPAGRLGQVAESAGRPLCVAETGSRLSLRVTEWGGRPLCVAESAGRSLCVGEAANPLAEK